MDEKYLEMAALLSADEVTINTARVRALQQTKPEGFDGTCTCGEPIPAERVALKYFNCVVCQGRKEDRRKTHR